jgi:hypothetical protein
MTRLTTLETASIDCSSSREISLFRRSAEQTEERPHRDLFLPFAERGEIRRLLQSKYLTDMGHLVEIIFTVAERLPDVFA